jgi:sulfur-oxidizing protein SoxY
MINRRHTLLLAGAALALRPAAATPEEMQAAVRAFTGGATTRPDARITLDIAPLVENGNTVPLTVDVDSPMTGDERVTAIALFNERNPQTEVAVFHFGPRAGRARVDTRIRLATSQRLVAVARFADGRVAQAAADVIVTLAACVEG